MSLIFRRYASSFPSLMTPRALKEHMSHPSFTEKFQILDATWDLPTSKRNPLEEHKAKRIPGAKFFDLDGCRDHSTNLPHMLPKTEHFEHYVSKLGIANDHHIVVYDNSDKFGLFSAPRVWWTFRVFGHDAISVLDGGLPKWIADDCATESGEYSDTNQRQDTHEKFKARFRPELVKDIEFVKNNMQSDNIVQVVDARPNGRFKGIAPEPRPDIVSGHIPKSLNVPFMDCLTRERGMKSIPELEKLFQERGVDINSNCIATCGSGVSACIVAYAAFLCNGKEAPVFDGSWVEWATAAPELIVKED